DPGRPAREGDARRQRPRHGRGRRHHDRPRAGFGALDRTPVPPAPPGAGLGLCGGAGAVHVTTTRLDGTAVDVAAPGTALALPRIRHLRLVLTRVLVATPAYPILFTITFLLQKVGESWSPLEVVTRALVALVVGVLALQLAIGKISSRHIAAYF